MPSFTLSCDLRRTIRFQGRVTAAARNARRIVIRYQPAHRCFHVVQGHNRVRECIRTKGRLQAWMDPVDWRRCSDDLSEALRPLV